VQARDIELGHFAAPDAGTPPGIVLIHDVWGLGDHARDLAQRLAGEGFGALAVDLYRREGDVKIEDPGAWMRALSDPQVLSDVQAALDFLAGRAETAGQRIGVTGFCMGGMYALMAASSCQKISAAVAYYGLLSHEHGILYDERGLDPARKPRPPLDYAPELRCPLLAFYGDRDEFVPLSDVRALEARLERVPHPTEVVVVPGAGHAFVNDTRPDAYRPDAARAAWAQMLAFLGAQLGG